MPKFVPGPVLVFSLFAEDVKTTAHFYRDVIGLSLLPRHGHRPAFELGAGAHLVIAKGRPAVVPDAERERFPAIAFAVQNLDGAVEHLGDHGVEMPWGIETGPDTRWAMFYDPAGNLVEFAQK